MGIFSNDNGKKLKEEEVVKTTSVVPTKESEVNSVCLISKETLIKGTIETASMFQLEGVLEGDIHGESLVHIGTTGKVKGNITSSSVLVDGEIHGEVFAERMEIGKTGRVYANIVSSIFVIQEGGLFEGNKKTKTNPIKEDKKLKLESKNENTLEDKNILPNGTDSKIK